MSRAQRVLLFACLFPSFVFSAPTAERAELMAVYRQAVSHNSDLAAARADYAAQQELVPQARANLLPVISTGLRLKPLACRVMSQRLNGGAAAIRSRPT